MKSPATIRKDISRERKKLGLEQLVLWIRPEWKQAILDYIRTLK